MGHLCGLHNTGSGIADPILLAYCYYSQNQSQSVWSFVWPPQHRVLTYCYSQNRCLRAYGHLCASTTPGSASQTPYYSPSDTARTDRGAARQSPPVDAKQAFDYSGMIPINYWRGCFYSALEMRASASSPSLLDIIRRLVPCTILSSSGLGNCYYRRIVPDSFLFGSPAEIGSSVIDKRKAFTVIF
ncbi:hypothetical protein J6590_013234 [Homalodisca vitripennis]|nr:hypothetical protein J6590_013234 [Homalodisca vitripennis]